MSLMPMLHAGKKEIWEAELALEYWNISSSLKLQSFQKIHMTIVQMYRYFEKWAYAKIQQYTCSFRRS